jgi:uncharacterized protein YuzE
MKVTYDPQHNIAYLQLREKQETVESIKISEELIIDMAKDGTVYGIELLNANEQLQNKESMHLLFVNEVTGEKKEMTI